MASQDKKQNVRTQKWRLMISQGINRDRQLMKTRIRKGIPMGIRMIAWPEIVNLKLFIDKKVKKYTYASLLKSFSNNIYEITLDIPRTFPQQEDSKLLRKSMNDVLKALSIVYPKIGYCQGMNFPTLRILQILDDQTAFWLLHYIYQNDQSIMRNFVDPKSVQRQNFIFTRLLKDKLPKIHDCFQYKNVVYQAYTMKWFMTLYSGNVSQQLFYRIFEVFLIDGWSIIFAVSLALLKNKQKQILSKQAQEIFFLFNSQIYQIKDIDAFMNLAYSFQITSQKVRHLGNEYDSKNQQNLQQSSRIRHNKQIQNRELSNKKVRQIQPQQQHIGIINFQNKGQQVSFQVFQLLINKNNQQNLQ